MADDDRTGRAGGPRPMRIGDADRQRMIDALQKHMGAGRLDMAEFERRVEHASAAIHDRDLDGLLDDLPPLDDEAAAGDRRDDRASTGRRGRPPRDRWWPPDTRSLGRPPWAWRGGIPAPLLVLGAIALVVLTHGWILFPLLFLVVFASDGGPCGPRGHHRHHGRRGRGGWEPHDRGDGPRRDDESVWDEPGTTRPTWPGRYDPDRDDDRIV